MSELAGLLVVLGIVYAFECVIRLPRGVQFLHSPWLASLSLGPSATPYRFGGRALAGVNPVPPFGETFLLWTLPFVASPEGVFLPGAASFEAWEEVRRRPSVDRFRSSLEHLAEAGHSAFARDYWRSSLEALTETPQHRRRERLEELLRARHHLTAASRRVARVREVTRVPRVLGTAQWLLVAIAIPLCAFLGLLDRFALPLYGSIALLHGVLVWVSGWAHQQIHGHHPGVGGYFLLALSPMHTMRSAEALSRESMIGFEACTVALAAGAPEMFLEMARQRIRELDSTNSSGDNVRTWWDHASHDALAGLLRTIRVSRTHLEMATDDDAGARTYCPMCHTMYSLESGNCADCDGITLRRLSRQQVGDARRVLERIESRTRHHGAAGIHKD